MTGTVSKLGNTYIIDAKITDLKEGKYDFGENENSDTKEGLKDASSKLVAKIVYKISNPKEDNFEDVPKLSKEEQDCIDKGNDYVWRNGKCVYKYEKEKNKCENNGNRWDAFPKKCEKYFDLLSIFENNEYSWMLSIPAPGAGQFFQGTRKFGDWQELNKRQTLGIVILGGYLVTYGAYRVAAQGYREKKVEYNLPFYTGNFVIDTLYYDQQRKKVKDAALDANILGNLYIFVQVAAIIEAFYFKNSLFTGLDDMLTRQNDKLFTWRFDASRERIPSVSTIGNYYDVQFQWRF
jgi:hypothetical protein